MDIKKKVIVPEPKSVIQSVKTHTYELTKEQLQNILQYDSGPTNAALMGVLKNRPLLTSSYRSF